MFIEVQPVNEEKSKLVILKKSIFKFCSDPDEPKTQTFLIFMNKESLFIKEDYASFCARLGGITSI